MDNQQLLDLYEQEERIRAEFPHRRREVTPWGVRHVPLDTAAGMRDGFVSYSRLNEQNVDQAIEEQIAYCESLGVSFEWKVYSHDTPADLRDRLAARGFEIDDPEAIMVLDLQRSSPVVARARYPRRAPDRRSGPDGRRRCRPESGLAGGAERDGRISQPDNARGSGDLSPCMRPMPMGRSFRRPGSTFRPPSPFAGLWGGSTLPAYRKQGFYTALVAVRVQEALRRGARFLTIDASPMSRPIVQRFGFQHITTAYACNWHHGATSRATGIHDVAGVGVS